MTTSAVWRAARAIQEVESSSLSCSAGRRATYRLFHGFQGILNGDLSKDSVSNSEEIPFGLFKLVPLAFEKSQPRHPSRKPRIHESQLLPDETSLYLETIYQILEERSPQAEPKRQSGVIIVPSIHIPGIREQLDKRIPHIMKKMPNLTNNQIRYLFRAPRRNTTNAKRYWGIIDARVAFGDNSLHEDHELVNLNNHLIDF